MEGFVDENAAVIVLDDEFNLFVDPIGKLCYGLLRQRIRRLA